MRIIARALYSYFRPVGNRFGFRSEVSTCDNFRARDDIGRNVVNLCAPVVTPINFPTWGHISQMAKRIRKSGIDWAPIKGDRASAQKQPPLGQSYANVTAAAQRYPSSGKWAAFGQTVLLVGYVSTSIRYNCFALALSIVINRYFGIPLFIYFGDSGDPPPHHSTPHRKRSDEGPYGHFRGYSLPYELSLETKNPNGAPKWLP